MGHIAAVNPNQLTSHLHLQEHNFIGGATSKQLVVGNNWRSEETARLRSPESEEVARLGHRIHSSELDSLISTPFKTTTEDHRESPYSTNYQPIHVEDPVVYKVQFKNSSGHYFNRSNSIEMLDIGEFVKVEADRGEDLGVVINACHMQDFAVERSNRKIEVKVDRPRFGNIVRVATSSERAQLPEKHRLEMYVLATCKELAQHVHHLPISVLNAVFQFDRHKLTIYYASNARVDFREFVRDLFAMFKSRIWMEKVQLFLPRDSDDHKIFRQALETGSYPLLSNPRQLLLVN
eukprot:CAMPEP_0201092206 /NCGR_PEP_ID=MMETSP0812-20130820/773_1 /ASSEMBLY_ACC=CAM_ASM_000668 /TAXON_ID=98059 /ORGANISM="Dinobryon sp., Strain UTEXLB2267" /LENGTH=291 /DNA_ID=CAMNT_0047343657 /DNA_START=490 /DNA_END=1365 /DNA_ORIENTATION=+